MIEQDSSGRKTGNSWGAIGYEGPVTPIVRIEGRFNSDRYLRILKSNVTPVMNRFENNGDPRIFMQDNAPQHTAKAVMSYLSGRPYEVMEWPPRSPDLNPIENLWGEMERDWPRIVPRNEERLDAVVQERWRAQSQHKIFILKRRQKILNITENVSLFSEYYHDLYRSLKTRCEMIIANDGDTIKY